MEGNPGCLQKFKESRGNMLPWKILISGGPEASLLQSSEEGTALCSINHCPEEHQEPAAAIAVIVVVPAVGMLCGCCAMKLCSRTPTVPWLYISTELSEPQNHRMV